MAPIGKIFAANAHFPNVLRLRLDESGTAPVLHAPAEWKNGT
jgi:hypothetical protein